MTAPESNRALMRRHAAAMKIIGQVDPDERLTLLTYVVVGTPRINDAVAEAERLGLSFPKSSAQRKTLTPV